MTLMQKTLEQINDGYRDTPEGRNIRGVTRYTEQDRGGVTSLRHRRSGYWR